jgi:hypothetical protein
LPSARPTKPVLRAAVKRARTLSSKKLH